MPCLLPRYGSTALSLRLLSHVTSVRCAPTANGPQTYVAVASRPQPVDKCGALASAKVADKAPSSSPLKEGPASSAGLFSSEVPRGPAEADGLELR